MRIEKDVAVRFHYTVGEVGQPPTETSRDGEAGAVLIGHNNLVGGLEKEMLGREAGDTFSVDVPAAEGYGERRDNATQRIPKKHFGKQRLVPGNQAVVQTDNGPRPVTVLKIGLKFVDVDLNHPMAGKDLHFDIEIVEIRAATPEELQHGHVHGEGGHHH